MIICVIAFLQFTTFSVAVCVPSTCNQRDIQILLSCTWCAYCVSDSNIGIVPAIKDTSKSYSHVRGVLTVSPIVT